jgi:DNA-binding transcriptional ArsR family regulator
MEGTDLNKSPPDQDGVFHAIADGNRRKLLVLLAEREMAVQDMVAPLGVTVGAVSQHLKILRENGLVTRRKAGRHRYYRAVPDSLDGVRAWTEKYRRFWESQFDALEEFLDNR